MSKQKRKRSSRRITKQHLYIVLGLLIRFSACTLGFQLGYEVNRVVIKNQQTRGDSCSTNKNINLNLRLMMTTPTAIDYIIIHELCHLIHMNHSKQFWSWSGNTAQSTNRGASDSSRIARIWCYDNI